MKKRMKTKCCPVPPQAEPDMAGKIIAALQDRLGLVERKIDMLISRFPERPSEVISAPKPFQHALGPDRQGEVRQDGNFRQRVLHKAVCADCHKDCEVPFKPSGNRPVYCKECFAKRRNAGLLKGRPVAMPREASVSPVRPAVRADSVKILKSEKKAKTSKRQREKNK